MASLHLEQDLSEFSIVTGLIAEVLRAVFFICNNVEWAELSRKQSVISVCYFSNG